MPILMMATVPNMTAEVYAGMMGQMMPSMRAHQGFVSHAGGPNPDGGWRVVEVWDSEEDADTWFEKHVAPNLPPDATPTRQIFPLHTAFTS